MQSQRINYVGFKVMNSVFIDLQLECVYYGSTRGTVLTVCTFLYVCNLTGGSISVPLCVYVHYCVIINSDLSEPHHTESTKLSEETNTKAKYAAGQNGDVLSSTIMLLHTTQPC